MNDTCNCTLFWVPVPLGHWGEAKRTNIIKSQLLSQFQRFFGPNFVCLLTNERQRTCQTGVLFDCLGHAPGVGLGGTVGVGGGVKIFFI